MTAQETRSLAPGDLVTWGPHTGRVVGVGPNHVNIEWQPKKATTHRRDQMTAVRRAENLTVSEQGT